jgi:biotin operon repressor
MTFEQEFTDEMFLKVLTNEFQSTADIMKGVGCSCTEVKNRLNSLAEAGKEINEQERTGGIFGFKEFWKLANAQA